MRLDSLWLSQVCFCSPGENWKYHSDNKKSWLCSFLKPISLSFHIFHISLSALYINCIHVYRWGVVSPGNKAEGGVGSHSAVLHAKGFFDALDGLMMSDLTPCWAVWQSLRKRWAVSSQALNAAIVAAFKKLISFHPSKPDSLILSSQLRIILICFGKMYFLSCWNMQNLIFAVVSQWSQRSPPHTHTHTLHTPKKNPGLNTPPCFHLTSVVRFNPSVNPSTSFQLMSDHPTLGPLTFGTYSGLARPC